MGNQLRNKIEFTKDEQDFLIELLMKNQFKKIVEIGVSRGGVSKMIMDYLPQNSKLFSIDLSSDFSVGEICKKKYNDDPRWKLYKGVYTFEVIEEIGSDIDMIILDTDHELPGELLDFLMVYPFLGENAIVIVHDILLYWLKSKTEIHSIAPRLLFNTLVGEKMNVGDWLEGNMGCVKLIKKSQDIHNILQCLKIPWNNLAIIRKIPEMKNFFLRYYCGDIQNHLIYFFEKIHRKFLGI